MQSSASTDKLFAALFAAKQQFTPILHNKVNNHKNYRYADLAAIFNAINPALIANKLIIMQWTENYVTTNPASNGPYCVTRLLHDSQEWIQVEMAMLIDPNKQDMHGYGAALTYAKRYSIASLLAIVADEDEDGTVDGKPVKMASTASTPPKAPPKAAPKAETKASPPHVPIINDEQLAHLQQILTPNARETLRKHNNIEFLTALPVSEYERVVKLYEKSLAIPPLFSDN